jgi:dienelactone hydrolase
MTRRTILLLVTVLLAGAAWSAAPYVSALALVMDLSGREIAGRAWLPVRLFDVERADVTLSTRHGAVPARHLWPAGHTPRGTLVVVPGVHAGGVDEPRLAALTARLAADGFSVISLPLPDLRQFRIVARATDQLEDAVVAITADRRLAPTGRVTLMGISFGGGLSLVAAGRPSLAGKLDRVVSFGGHGLLPRVIDYLCTGRLPDGVVQPAHDYGLAVLLLAAIPKIVPADQAAPLDAAVRLFLEASMAEGRHASETTALFAQARQLSDALAEPARSVMVDVNDRAATRLGPLLLPHAEWVGGDPGLSPERSPAPRVPVYLIHGAIDPVIPQTELPSLAEYLRAHGTPRVDTLLTPAVSHADAQANVAARDVWNLVRTWVAIGSGAHD